MREFALSKNSRLAPGPVGRARARQDFFDPCLVDRKLSLHMGLEKMQPVIPPEHRTVDHEARYAKYPGRNGVFGLRSKFFLDLLGLGLVQQFVALQPRAGGDLPNDNIRRDISSIAPCRIEKLHGKNFSKLIVADGADDAKRFERIERVSRRTFELESQMKGPALRVLKRVTTLGRDFCRAQIRMMLQQAGKKHRHKPELGARAFPHPLKLMAGKPDIRTDEIEIEVEFMSRNSRQALPREHRSYFAFLELPAHRRSEAMRQAVGRGRRARRKSPKSESPARGEAGLSERRLPGNLGGKD
jgi:hypothetical protein